MIAFLATLLWLTVPNHTCSMNSVTGLGSDLVVIVGSSTEASVSSNDANCNEFDISIDFELIPDSAAFQVEMQDGTLKVTTTEQSKVGKYPIQMKACFVSNPNICNTAMGTISIKPTYDSLQVIELPTKTIWPTQEELEKIPMANFTLSELRYSLDMWRNWVTTLQLVFANGVESMEIKVDEPWTNQTETVNITGDVRYVSMKLSRGFISGVRLYDQADSTIVDISTFNGQWTPIQAIPAEQQIIGLKCDTWTDAYNLLNPSTHQKEHVI